MNNFNNLFLFYFGSRGDEILHGGEKVSRTQIKEILASYSRSEINQLVNNLKGRFILFIDLNEKEIEFNDLKSDNSFKLFNEVSTIFEQELQLCFNQVNSFKTFTTEEIKTYLTDLLRISLDQSVYHAIGSDPIVSLLNEIKRRDLEQYSIFRTFMQYRAPVWTSIVSSASSRKTPQEKFQALVAALTKLMENGVDYFRNIECNFNLTTKDYLSITNGLDQHFFSIPAFLTYLLKHPSKFPMR